MKKVKLAQNDFILIAKKGLVILEKDTLIHLKEGDGIRIGSLQSGGG